MQRKGGNNMGENKQTVGKQKNPARKMNRWILRSMKSANTRQKKNKLG